MAAHFFNEFTPSTIEEWEERLNKDLKGENPRQKLTFHDEIEVISFSAYHNEHQIESSDPGSPPYLRGSFSKDNAWVQLAKVIGNSPSEMNKKALHLLMNGATGLIIDCKKYSPNECQKILADIQLEYISTTFICHNDEQLSFLTDNIKNVSCSIILKHITKINLDLGVRTNLVDGTEVQRIGGNSMQEIAYLLHKGHEELYKLLSAGISIDDATPKILFKMGIGSNYFFQIAKQRVFRKLWSQVVDAYQPIHECSKAPYVTAETGLLNKSLKDPHTNLLRQTTEALSAIVGGINELHIQPYNSSAQKANNNQAQRLALNIGLILQEESYLDKVIDPVGGSYSIEKLTQTLTQKAWSLFQEIEQNGIELLKSKISTTRSTRIRNFENHSFCLIGINKYFNEDQNQAAWLPPEKLTLGEELILDRDCKIENPQ